MPNRDRAEVITEQAIGSISPLGHYPRVLRTILDKRLFAKGTSREIFVGGAKPGFDLSIKLDELMRLLEHAEVADISVNDGNSSVKHVHATQNLMKKLSNSDNSFSSSTGERTFKISGRRLKELSISKNTEEFEKVLNFIKEEKDAAAYSINQGGKTALHLAAWKGPIPHVILLLEHGADINAYSTGPGNYGKTAIFYAITQCRDKVVVELLNRGAHVKIVNNKGQTPRSLAYTHLERQTMMLIDDAEKNQSSIEWQNFYEQYNDGFEFGDLDPRFVKEDIILENGDHRPWSINPTTFMSRKKHWANYRERENPVNTIGMLDFNGYNCFDVENGLFDKYCRYLKATNTIPSADETG